MAANKDQSGAVSSCLCSTV